MEYGQSTVHSPATASSSAMLILFMTPTAASDMAYFMNFTSAKLIQNMWQRLDHDAQCAL